MSFKGQDILLLLYFETNFSGCNKIWGHTPKSPSWLRACAYLWPANRQNTMQDWWSGK